MLKSYENFKIQCPQFIKDEVESGNVKIIQLVELEHKFALLTYDLNTKTFYVGTTSKAATESLCVDNYREYSNSMIHPDDEINKANLLFIDLLDDLT